MSVLVDISKIDKIFHVSEKALRIATRRAMTRTATTLQNRVKEETKKQLAGFKTTNIKKSVRKIKPSAVLGTMEGGIEVLPTQAPLSQFKGRKIKTGWSSTIKKKVKIKGAFKAKMKSGHESIFIRTSKKRLPIKKLFSTRPYDVVKDDFAKHATEREIQEIFLNHFSRELNYQLSLAG